MTLILIPSKTFLVFTTNSVMLFGRLSHVKFAVHMRRKDLDADLVAYSNTYLSQNLGNFFKSTKLIKRNDFDDDTPYHFNVFGEGYRHLAALIYSVLREFNDLW